jgi:hypothetical protein
MKQRRSRNQKTKPQIIPKEKRNRKSEESRGRSFPLQIASKRSLEAFFESKLIGGEITRKSAISARKKGWNGKSDTRGF